MSSLPIDPRPEGMTMRLHTPDEADTASSPDDASNPLSEAYLCQIEELAKRAKPIEKGVRYAHFSGWTTLLAGALSVPFALHNAPLLIFSVVIAGVGMRELTVRKELKGLDLSAPKKLAINQLVLGGALIVYALYMLTFAPSESMVESAMISDPTLASTPEISGMMDDMVELEKFATAMMYVGMIVLAVLVQGGTALYYLRKGTRLKQLYQQTPPWAVEVYKRVHR